MSEQDSNQKEGRVGVKLLQCNDEMCQYELKPDGDIEWAAQATNTVRFTWDSPPKTCLIIKKPNAPEASAAMIKVASLLHDKLKITILVEPAVKAEFSEMPFLVSLVEDAPAEVEQDKDSHKSHDAADAAATATAAHNAAAIAAALREVRCKRSAIETCPPFLRVGDKEIRT